MINARKKEAYQNIDNFKHCRVSYKRVNEIKNLGAQINDENYVYLEVRARLAAENYSYYALQKLLRLSYLNKKLNIFVCKIGIEPAVLYGSGHGL